MGALIAVIDKRAADTESAAAQMLLSLGHRGTREGVSTRAARNFAITLGCLSQTDISARYFESDRFALAIDGSFYGEDDPSGFVRRRLAARVPLHRGVRSLMRVPGGFAILFIKANRIYAFRDPNGIKPLYIARQGKRVALASERKALWRIGMEQTDRILPGLLYRIRPGEIGKTKLHAWRMPTQQKMPLARACRRLRTLLIDAAQRITERVSKLGIAFSGGIDSALTASLASGFQPDIRLFSVGLSGSAEFSQVESYAKLLNLPVITETYEEADLEVYVRRVIWLIEEHNLMKVSVAVPLHWTAMLAGKNRTDVLLCGQGSDELFGGYAKYARTLDLKGRVALAKELFRSVVYSYQMNYERDDQATSPSGVELRTPFANLRLIDFSLRIPTEFKVEPGNDTLRKHVLRRVAAQMGLPNEIVWRRKKAIQHGTGVENAIRRLASKKGLRVDDYLAKLHGEVIKMDAMP